MYSIQMIFTVVLIAMSTAFLFINILSMETYTHDNIYNDKMLRNITHSAVSNYVEPNSKIPLEELVGKVSSAEESACLQKGGFMFHDTVLPESVTHYNRKIPKVIHFTSRSRCLTKQFYDNIIKWRRFDNYSIYFHDEDAMDRLMFRKWDIFPHLQEVMKCIGAGAEKSDLWRYLLIWEYGGMYTDIDNAPGIGADNGNIIIPTDDAFFLKERGGFPSQFFFAASPYHPILYFSVTMTLKRLLEVDNLATKYVPFVTGPGAVKSAFIAFMKEGYPKPGIHSGVDNRNVTCKDNTGILRRDSVGGKAKKDGYKNMSMGLYGGKGAQQRRHEQYSCLQLLYEQRKQTLTSETMRFT